MFGSIVILLAYQVLLICSDAVMNGSKQYFNLINICVTSKLVILVLVGINAISSYAAEK